ncbi:MAG: fimbrillin family protein [Bacteroidales bacterium]|nr:fimbrillin family protein [Bacteroidales bacterium]
MMKGTKYFWLAAMLCLASCTPNGVLIDETPEPEEAPRRIGFETFVNKALRAAGTNSNELNDFYPTFNVYGWKFVGGLETCVFNNVPVEYFAADAAGSVVYTSGKPSNEWNAFSAGWYYQDIRYWDQMASNYQFSAYAPAAASSDVDCESDGTIKIGDNSSPITVDAKNLMATPATELAYTGFNHDYMTATATSATSPVSLTFKHLQAKFNVRIKLAASVTTAQDVSVQKVEIHNLGDKAYYLSSAVAPAVDGWTLGTVTPTYVPKVHTAYSLNNAVKNYHNHYVLEQLIIPQTISKAASSAPSLSEFTEACVYVEYKIGAETFKNFTPLANIFDDSAATTYDFKAGNQYTLNITIGPAPIYFEPQVATWATATEGNLNQN